MISSAAAAVAREVPILTGHAAVELVIEDDRVVGVIAQTPDGRRRFDGAVVIATSG